MNQLEQIQQQLKMLQQYNAQPQTPTPQPTLQEIIANTINAEFNKRFPPPPPELTPIELVGKAFTNDQHQFVSDNSAKFRPFLASQNGKAAMQLVYEAFVEYCG